MRGAHATDVTTDANTTDLDHPPVSLQTLAVNREADIIYHHDHPPEEETGVAEDVAVHVAATDHMAATEDVTD
eukprot:1138590-Pyramimonas_sp.AAC.1